MKIRGFFLQLFIPFIYLFQDNNFPIIYILFSVGRRFRAGEQPTASHCEYGGDAALESGGHGQGNHRPLQQRGAQSGSCLSYRRGRNF